MIKKIGIGVLVLFSMCSYLSAENVLKNGKFAEKSVVGLPLHWELRGTGVESCSTADNVVKLSGGKADVGTVLVQHGLALKGGSLYILRFKIRSTKDSRCRVYCAWTVSRDGKTLWPGSDTKWYPATTEWKEREVSFKYDTTATPAYLAIEVAGDGEAEFKDLVLEQDKNDSLLDKSKLLVNGDFTVRDANNKPLVWEARGEDKSFSYENGGVMMKGSDGKDLTLVQHDLPLQAKASYEVSYEVKGSLKDKEYRVYYEVIQVIDGKDVWKSFATEFCKTSDQWETKGFTFSFPEKVRSSHLVFNVKAGVNVEFRNITLKSIDEKSNK